MNELRVVIDTTVVVSAVLLPQSVPRQAFDSAADEGRLLLSAATIAELDEVLRRPKFNKYVGQQQRLEFLAALIDRAEAIEIAQPVTGCRDPKDDKFLELAVNGRVSHIISGDADLLVLHAQRDPGPAQKLANRRRRIRPPLAGHRRRLEHRRPSPRRACTAARGA
jgi:putative PIN family toxin of toxin-antitoxin system